jgi:hypothetical protein
MTLLMGHLHVIAAGGDDDPRILYSLGANTAAVRCIAPTAIGLAAAGDDGTAIVYDFA